jgi:hypothetical protein
MDKNLASYFERRILITNIATARKSYVYDVSEDGFHAVLLYLPCGARLIRVALITSTEEGYRAGLRSLVGLHIVCAYVIS